MRKGLPKPPFKSADFNAVIKTLWAKTNWSPESIGIEDMKRELITSFNRNLDERLKNI